MIRGLAFFPSMWAWSLNLQRFLSPIAGWAPWTLATLAMIPAFSRALVPFFDRAGRALFRPPITIAWMMGAAALVWSLPDRTRFLGDFLLRQGTIEMGGKPEELFPQAFPLDVFLHYTIPLWMVGQAGFDPGEPGRLIGALDAAILAFFAAAFARVLGVTGAPAVAVTAVVFFGGYLGVFTGYCKAFNELCVLVAAFGVLAVRVVREGRGLMALGVVLAVSLALHRSALLLLPAAAWVWALWLRTHGAHGQWRRPAALAGLAVPLVVLVVLLPRLFEILLRVDFGFHLAPVRFAREGASWASVLSLVRISDLVNLALLLSPLALATPGLVLALRRNLPDSRELSSLSLLALSFAIMPLVVEPAHGILRDWDIFAVVGMPLSLLAAWWVAQTLRAGPRHLARRCGVSGGRGSRGPGTASRLGRGPRAH